jgi:septal ring factor EnvC (AmiA/AmiB activator)
MRDQHHPPKPKVLLEFQDEIPTGGTAPSDALPVTSTAPMGASRNNSSGTAPSVEEEPRRFAALLDFVEKFYLLISFIIAVAIAVAAFIVFQSDLSKAKSDIEDHEKKLTDGSRDIVKLDKRLLSSQKDIRYLESKTSKLEAGVEDVNREIQSVKTQQAILSDRSARK